MADVTLLQLSLKELGIKISERELTENIQSLAQSEFIRDNPNLKGMELESYITETINFLNSEILSQWDGFFRLDSLRRFVFLKLIGETNSAFLKAEWDEDSKTDNENSVVDGSGMASNVRAWMQSVLAINTDETVTPLSFSSLENIPLNGDNKFRVIQNNIITRLSKRASRADVELVTNQRPVQENLPIVEGKTLLLDLPQGTDETQAIDNVQIEGTISDQSLDGATVSIKNPVPGDTLALREGYKLPDGMNFKYDPEKGKATISGNSSPEEYKEALENIVFFNTTGNPSQDGTRSNREFEIVITDGDRTSLPAVNDPPFFENEMAKGYFTFYERDEVRLYTPLNLRLKINDSDGDILTSATIKIINPVPMDELKAVPDINGEGWKLAHLKFQYDLNTGIGTITGKGTFSEYATYLGQIFFYTTSENPDNYGTRKFVRFSTTVNDGKLDSKPFFSKAEIFAENDVPELQADATSTNHTENGEATTIVSNVDITDVDSKSIVSATIAIQDPVEGDLLTLNAVLPDGMLFDFNSKTGIGRISGQGTFEQYEAALEAVRFSTSSENPDVNGTRMNRTFKINVNDGKDNSVESSATIGIEAQNDVPIITSQGPANNYDQGGPAVMLFNNLNIDDPDSFDLFSATIVIVNGKPGDELTLSPGFELPDGVTFKYNPDTHTALLSGPATLESYSNILKAVTFRSKANDLNAETRNVQLYVTDSANGNSQVFNTSLNVIARPIIEGKTLLLDLPQGTDETQAIDNVQIEGTISDQSLDGATVSIKNPVPGDTLALREGYKLPDGMNFKYDPEKGKATISGNSSPEEYKEALENIVFFNTTGNPSQDGTRSNREFEIVITDGDRTSLPAVNDPPFFEENITTRDFYTFYEHDEGRSYTPLNLQLKINDSDGDILTSATIKIINPMPRDELRAFPGLNNEDSKLVHLKFQYDWNTGIGTITGKGTFSEYATYLGQIFFYTTSENPDNYGTRKFVQFSTTVNDGKLDSTPIFSKAEIFPENDVPELQGDNSDESFLVGSGTGVPIISNVDITDVDSKSIVSATITIQDPVEGDLLTLNAVLPDGMLFDFNSETGISRISGQGTFEQYEAALEAVRFSTSSENLDTDGTVSRPTRTFTFSVNDDNKKTFEFKQSQEIETTLNIEKMESTESTEISIANTTEPIVFNLSKYFLEEERLKLANLLEDENVDEIARYLDFNFENTKLTLTIDRDGTPTTTDDIISINYKTAIDITQGETLSDTEIIRNLIDDNALSFL